MKNRLEDFLRFKVSTSEAREIQRMLAPRVNRADGRRNFLGAIRTVAGADISLREDDGFAAVILYSFPTLTELERASAVGKIRFPYVPGLLSFREVPLLLKAIAKLQRKPDLIIVDGQGIAHPRRIGLASHLGLALDTPTIGSAKSLLIGDYEMPGESRGSAAPLMAGRERIGTVLRTRDGVRPMFISTGHRVSLRSAVKFVLRCGDGFRLPKPQREADLWTKQLRCGK